MHAYNFMEEEKKFPLIVWEQTEEFKNECLGTQKKLDELHKRWIDRYGGGSYVGSLRFDADCEPEFWINDLGSFATGRFYGENRKWSSEEALKSALRYGDSGYWGLKDLEELIDGEGILLENAMFDCGFRKHKKHPEKWVRKKKEDQDPCHRRWEAKHKIECSQISAEDTKRMGEFVLPNKFAGLNNTYSIEANNKGMVYVELLGNPFSGSTAETLQHLETVMNDRGHIARNQNGFSIEAKNIIAGKEKGVHIKATRPDDAYIECIWPTQTPKEDIYYLANSLVSTIKVSDNIYRDFCLTSISTV